MSNTGLTTQSGAKTFQREGKLGQILPIGFLTFGVGSMGVAVLTALTPPPVAFLAKVAGILDQVGLDKGPLLMFGVLSTAMGFALSRLEKASRGGSAAADAASFAQANAGTMELQSEILGSVQAELGSIRHEISTARREAQEEKVAASDHNGEASDPLFRLAASLDQLGAQIDKRIDKARREMIEAVAGVAGTVEVSAQQREDAFTKSASDVDSVRMDIADLRAQLTRVATDVSSAKTAVADLKMVAPVAAPIAAAVVPEAPAEKPAEKAAEKAAEKPAESSIEDKADEVEAPAAELSPAALPIELTDAADSAVEDSAPAAPIPSSAAQEETSSEPQFEGFQFEKDSEEESDESPEPEAPSLGVSMQGLGFPEPPAPMPKPSQDLGLIDEMQKDTARLVDETPPLFPDAFDQQ